MLNWETYQHVGQLHPAAKVTFFPKTDVSSEYGVDTKAFYEIKEVNTDLFNPLKPNETLANCV